MVQARPPIDGKAQRDGGGIERINVVGDEKITHDATFFFGEGNHLVGKLLKYPNLAHLVRLAEVAAADALPETQVMECCLERREGHD